jgi:hypothetical protein
VAHPEPPGLDFLRITEPLFVTAVAEIVGGYLP